MVLYCPDKNGRLVKGIAPIETENKLADSLTTTAAITSSNISWTGYGEIGGYSLTGSIKLKNADIEMSKKILKSADIIIDMASITHEQQKLEEHLKSEDFFNVVKYPTAEFVSDNIQYINANNAIANGKLTIKGITKPFSLPLLITDAGKNVIVKSKMLIDRTAYGIKFNSKSFFSNLGNQAIKNNFDLSFELKLN